MCGGLERQSGIRFALLARHHKLISCPTLAPTKLVCVCIVQVLFPSRRIGIAPPPVSFFLYRTDVIPVKEHGHSPPPPSNRGPGCDWDYKLSLYVAGHSEEYITLLRLMVVASSRLLLVPEGVGLMPVISMCNPFST